ncbi:hypothetical protein JGI1_00892 [Candidatus Thermokryptus mobilis]|uniref:NHL repeat-containing protein n=1 Tax=Candidatus Thermokryptus mobilis TaxID=1643428 RepID=A0A0S4MYM3_9BACT|nr:hypothetical protein [Candidatus Thermokryptus mobilis]CUU04068.1 hypothetical protein JGI1_00892 [Candidatus Thermokryptus mobilis]
MSKFFLPLLILCTELISQNIWFSDDFSGSLKSEWIEISGKWRVEKGRLVSSAIGKTNYIGLNFIIPPRSNYRINLSFSGENMILMFNLYDIFTWMTGNFVKFYKNALYTGLIGLNGDEKINKFVSLPDSRRNFNTIEVVVSNGRYSIYFNKKKYLEEKLYFGSGYIVIGVSEGKTEFDYFIISSNERYKSIDDLKKLKEPIIDHISSIAIIDSARFALSSDVYSHVQVIDTGGNLLNKFTYLRWCGGLMYHDDGLYIGDIDKIIVVYPKRTLQVAQFMVKMPNYIYADAERIYVIDGSAIKIFNRDFRLMSSFTDPENLKFPTAIASDKYNIYCADPTLGHIAVYSKSSNKFLRSIKGQFVAPVDLKYDSVSNSIYVADVGLKAVVKVRGEKVEKTFEADEFGGLKFPRSIDLKYGMIYIADADKVVSIDTTFTRAKIVLKR